MLSDDEEDDDEDEEEEADEDCDTKKNTTKRGRKGEWPEEWTNDLVDIILNDDVLKNVLLLTNVKTVKNSKYFAEVVDELESRHTNFKFNVKQTRSKFRRCVTMCKSTKLIEKTKSGIKRFQEKKKLGVWFPRLIEIVLPMHSAHPEQANELSSGNSEEASPENGTETEQMESESLCLCTKQPIRRVRQRRGWTKLKQL